MTVGVAIHEAALGARIDLPAPDGAIRLRVPPGSQSGQRFRVRERGMPLRDGGRGDVIVEVQIVLPKLLDERSKELLREFGRLNGASVRESAPAPAGYASSDLDGDRSERARGNGKAQS